MYWVYELDSLRDEQINNDTFQRIELHLPLYHEYSHQNKIKKNDQDCAKNRGVVIIELGAGK